MEPNARAVSRHQLRVSPQLHRSLRGAENLVENASSNVIHHGVENADEHVHEPECNDKSDAEDVTGRVTKNVVEVDLGKELVFDNQICLRLTYYLQCFYKFLDHIGNMGFLL